MKTLRQALDDYLVLRQAMGFKLSEARTLLPQFVDFLDDQGAIFITTEWAVEWATQPVISNPPDGQAAYAGCVDLHATTAPSTPVLRSRRRRYYRTVLSVTRLISTAMPRLLSLLRPPAVYPPLRGCAPAPTLQFSVCSWSPACASVNLWGWTITIAISKTDC